MALPQDLVDALRKLTTAMDQDRLAAQTQAAQLLNALDQQRAQSANLVQQLTNNAAGALAAAVPTPRVAAAAVESIPCFEDRVAVAEGWTDAERIQVAARRLLKTALDWHIHTGQRMRPGMIGLEHSLQIFHHGYTLVNGSDGLANWQHGAAMTANRPDNVTEFIQRIRALETLGVASRVFPPPIAPPVAPPTALPAGTHGTTNTPPVPDLNTTLTAFGNQLFNQLTAQFNKMAIGSRGAGRGGGGVSGGDRGGVSGGDRGGGSGGDRGGGGWVDSSKRKCYNCGVVGHISRHCPTKSGKGVVMIRPNLCAQPGSEWVIPCCVVQVEAGKLKVPVLNMQTSSFNLRRKDLLAFVDRIDADS
ncbi:hypothetical protein OUZ56_018485 [Daphnia magna]|uniref:CCHC-type domain-containing protein n=1 Tax=Daphnia magna TaxID=35525 RepID=A0ABQ9Z900_9CRUS|nr:hypothetical protein OUZ56_018485 [Daphnia magna]